MGHIFDALLQVVVDLGELTGFVDLVVVVMCHNCTYLSGFDLLALIEFRLESSRAAGVLREEISFLKRGSFAGGKEAGRRASRGCEDPVSF